MYIECRVEGTPDSCVFPFKYKGQLYDQCIFEDSEKPWCAFNVRPYVDVTSDHRFRGDCEDRCPQLGKKKYFC